MNFLVMVQINVQWSLPSRYYDRDSSTSVTLSLSSNNSDSDKSQNEPEDDEEEEMLAADEFPKVESSDEVQALLANGLRLLILPEDVLVMIIAKLPQIECYVWKMLIDD